ncbi:biotin--[acetyl-CoA-carboxylase] ligase [Sphingomonas sinipercae]|uniref:biotin--[acetyl-CoA-carboxylase] ligase n=1 Tax=Sphingomonas sinipercae TaxID=2714944 RepID=UPI001FE6CBA0|nr:biotin--[acetyl-CoA-carboxylase] ligase [Sphingomonas sinipercae]
MVERTGSTNADLLADSNSREGDWLVALAQDSGRGRQGRSWVAQPGNFFGSTVVELKPGDPAPQSLSLVASLALVEAVDVAAPGAATMLKWPNDLLLNGAKFAGILLERSGDRVIVGIGVNLAAAPALPDRRVDHLDGRITPQAFAPLLAGSMAKMLGLWRATAPDAFACAWLARAHPVGTELKVHSEEAEAIEGRFDGIDPDGTLRLRLADGSVRAIHAADVSLS